MTEHLGPDLVSVLLPCRDQFHAMRTRVIPSVLSQTHAEWELIVVSEGEDNVRMRAVVSEFDDARISYLEVPRNRDVERDALAKAKATNALALHRGRERARGAFISVLDEDSEYLPDHLAASIDALREQSADLVFGAAAVHDPNTGERRTEYVEPRDLRGRADLVHHASVCFTSASQAVDFGATETVYDTGARVIGLADPQIVSYGDGVTGRVRVSMPSLPPVEDLHHLVDVIAASRQLSNHGPINASLEKRLESYIGARHVITAASGDTALGMAMIYAASRYDDRDEVVLPSYTFPSTVNMVIRAGLTPVFCDIDPSNLCASAATMAPLVSERTVALAPVYAHGAPCEMYAIEELARDAGALLISDAAAALGATIGGRQAGSFGDMEMFSLSSTKVVTAGEGGFLTLHDDEAEARLREIGRYGLDGHFSCVAAGVNGRLAEFSAGIALAAMDHIDGWLAARHRTAALYEQGLAGLQHLRVIPHRIADRIGSAKDVVLVVQSPALRDDLAERLLRNRIETRPYFRPTHVMAPFKHLQRTHLAVTEQYADCMLSLPITNEIPAETTQRVIDVLIDELRDAVGG